MLPVVNASKYEKYKSIFDPVKLASDLDAGKVLLLPFYQIYKVVDESLNQHFELKYDNESGLWWLNVYRID